MATTTLVASTYSVSNSTVTVSDANNMYTDVDSTTYATITHTTSSTTSYYCYIKGFNLSSIPSDVDVTGIVIRIKGYESGLSTSTTYAPRLYNNTSTITGASAATTSFGSSSTTITVPYTGTWDTLKACGSDLGIRVAVRRSNKSNQGYLYVYGAEIEVTYSEPRTVTTSLTGNGTIHPSGTETMHDGDEYYLTIEPTNESDTVTVTRNGTDITSQITKHQGGEYNESDVLGAYHLVSGGFNGSGATYFQGLVGKGHTATATTSNYYSSSSGTTAVFQYAVPFEVPDNATIKSLYMMASGHAESTSNSNEYMCVQLKSGSTALSEQYNFKSAGTSNSTQTINATTLPTPAQLADLVVECTLGYYGGAINGVTVYLTYEVAGAWYTYSETISGNLTIAVTISGGGVTNVLYVKVNGSWVAATAAYKKVNGSWVLQSDLTTVFDANTNYVKG